MKYIGSVSACTSREEATFTFEAPDGASADEIYAIAEREAMNHIDIGYRVADDPEPPPVPCDPFAKRVVELLSDQHKTSIAATKHFFDIQ